MRMRFSCTLIFSFTSWLQRKYLFLAQIKIEERNLKMSMVYVCDNKMLLILSNQLK